MAFSKPKEALVILGDCCRLYSPIISNIRFSVVILLVQLQWYQQYYFSDICLSRLACILLHGCLFICHFNRHLQFCSGPSRAISVAPIGLLLPTTYFYRKDNCLLRSIYGEYEDVMIAETIAVLHVLAIHDKIKIHI